MSATTSRTNSLRHTPRTCSSCTVRGLQSFCDLSTPSLLDLDQIATSINLPAHATLLSEGFAADRVFILCSGRVKLMASSPEGNLLLLRIAGPGDVLGLASILRGTRYRISAETLEPCTAKSVLRSEFLRFMHSAADVSESSTRAMAREYDAALLSARRLALSTSAAGKLASTLLDWARSGNSSSVVPLAFHMPLTHEELGSMAGLSRETVTRLLSSFRKQGLLKQHGESFLLPNPEQLESLYC